VHVKELVQTPLNVSYVMHGFTRNAVPPTDVELSGKLKHMDDYRWAEDEFLRDLRCCKKFRCVMVRV